MKITLKPFSTTKDCFFIISCLCLVSISNFALADDSTIPKPRSENESAVPKSNTVTNDFKSYSDKANHTGNITSSASKLKGGGGTYGAVLSGTGAAVALPLNLNDCINKDLESCADLSKNSADVMNAGHDVLVGTRSIKSVPVIGHIYNAVDIGSSAAIGDYVDVIDKSFSIGLNAVAPPLGLIKGIADSACDIAYGNSCTKLGIEAQAKADQNSYDATGCFNTLDRFGNSFWTCDDQKGKEINANKQKERELTAETRRKQFEEIEQKNEQAAQIKREYQLSASQEAVNTNNENDFNLIADVFSAVVTGIAEAEKQNQTRHPNSSSLSAGGAGGACVQRVFETPDGCHPNHDEASHPRGCKCSPM